MSFDWNASPTASSASNSTASSAVGGIGTGLAETFIQDKLNKDNAKIAFERQQKLLRQEYDYNQQAQKNSIVNLAQSAKDAGLSPVALTGQSFSPSGASASGVSSASVSRPDFGTDSNLAREALLNQQIADLQSSIDLKKSQKSNVDADTDAKNLANDSTRDANQAATENMREHLEGMKVLYDALGIDSSMLDAKIDDIDKGVRIYTQGAIRLNSEFEKYRASVLDNVPKYEQTNFDYKVAQLKNENPKIADAIATLPVSEQDKINAEITKIYSEAYKLQTSAQLDASKIDEIETNIKALVQRMKSEYLRDPRLMLADEDYAHFASWLGMDVYEKGMSVLQSLIQMRSGQAGAQALQDAKQAGAEKLEQSRQAGAEKIQQMKNAPTTTTREFFDKTGEVQGGYRESKSYPEQQNNYKQPPARRKRRR